MKVAFEHRSPAVQERMRHRLQVGINDLRHDVGWDWELTNAHCCEVFGAISQEMTIAQLYRNFTKTFTNCGNSKNGQRRRVA